MKKRCEDMTTSVKRKERQARQEETKGLKVTGNGNLPDEEVRSIRKWFEPRINVPLLKKIIWVVGVTRGTTTRRSFSIKIEQ